MAGTANLPDEVVILYGKPGCCLCDDAKPLVAAAAMAHGLGVQVVSILQDAALLQRYRWRIPVVVYRGEILDEGRVSGERIAAALRRAPPRSGAADDGRR